MRVKIAILLAAFFYGFPSLAAPLELASVRGQYSLELDTAAITGGLLGSKLRILVNENFAPIANVRNEHSSESTDLGTTVELDYSVIEAAASARTQVLLDGAKLVEESHGRNTFTTTMKDRVPGYEGEVFLLPGFGSTSAHRYIDKSGEAVYVTVTVQNSGNLFLDPATKSYVQFRDAIRVVVNLVLDKPMGGSYEIEEGVDGGVEAGLVDCASSGQTIALAPMPLALGASAERVQYCVGSRAGLTPLVLIKNNPTHEPLDMIKRVDDAALRDGGWLVENPLVKLERTSLANCLGYAVLASLGKSYLPENTYWIQGAFKRSYTFGTLPMPAILENFHSVASVPSSYGDTKGEESLATNPNLKAGDIALFVGTGGIAHAGVVVAERGEWWLEQKFEEGPVLRTPIKAVHNVIGNLYKSIEIYRKN